MSTDTSGLLMYAALVASLAVVAHFLVRRLWFSCVAVSIVCAIINIGHEVFIHAFRIRPSDVAIWLPMLFVYGFIVAFPIALLLGLPFAVIRRRRKTA